MMKPKKFWFLSLIVLTTALMGCSSILGPAEEETTTERLDINDWPTSVPTTGPATATPFSKATAPPATPTPTTSATPLPSPEADDKGAESVMALADMTSPEALRARAARLMAERLPSVGVAITTVDEATLRQGPGEGYGSAGVFSRGEVVGVSGQDAAGNWFYVLGTTQRRGWLPAAALRFVGALDKAPVVPPDPLGAIVAELRSSAGSAPATGAGGADVSENESADRPAPAAARGETAPPQPDIQPVSDRSPAEAAAPTAFGGLAPVTTAQIDAREVDLRWGPGPEYGVIDTLTADDTMVAVLAQDATAQWLLVQVQRFAEELGWIAVSDLALEGSFEAAPPVITARVSSNEINVRRGPGIYEDKIGVLGINSLVVVHGLSEDRSWALAQPPMGAGLGWTQIKLLEEVSTPLAEVPQAPAIPVSPPAAEEPAEPLPPPPIPPRAVEDSRLVIQLASGGDIMVINPDGTGLRRLTTGIDPALSPDGQTVALTRWQGETGSLWLVDIDGSNERQQLGFIKQAKGPAWSPDQTQIVLNFQQGGRLKTTSNCTDLTQDEPATPPRSATNIRVTIDDSGERGLCWDLPPDPYWNLKVVDLADGSAEDLDGGTYAFRPAWDPAQPWRIISDGGRGLLAVSVADDYSQEISDNVSDGSPVFSPDGRYLALTAGRRGGDSGYDIYRMNRDGSGRVRLTETPLWVPVQPDSSGKQWNNVAPAWSPDGSQIAFVTDRTGRWEIWIMNADGSDQQPMFSAEINDRLPITYNFVDERVISWR